MVFVILTSLKFSQPVRNMATSWNKLRTYLFSKDKGKYHKSVYKQKVKIFIEKIPESGMQPQDKIS